MGKKKHVFDDPRNVKRLLVAFFTVVGLLLCLDFFVHKHTHFPWEEGFGFYAIFGFVACVCLVLAAKYVLRPLVMRGEDFYE